MSVDFVFSAPSLNLIPRAKATFSIGSTGDAIYQFVSNGANSLLLARGGGTTGEVS